MTSAPDQLLMIVGAVHVFDSEHPALRGRPVLLPGVEDHHTKGLVGAAVRVVRPDGSAFVSKIAGIEMATPNFARRYGVLLSSLAEDQPMPPGSELWLLRG